MLLPPQGRSDSYGTGQRCWQLHCDTDVGASGHHGAHRRSQCCASIRFQFKTQKPNGPTWDEATILEGNGNNSNGDSTGRQGVSVSTRRRGDKRRDEPNLVPSKTCVWGSGRKDESDTYRLKFSVKRQPLHPKKRRKTSKLHTKAKGTAGRVTVTALPIGSFRPPLRGVRRGQGTLWTGAKTAIGARSSAETLRPEDSGRHLNRQPQTL